jgi:exodeoxyribonuclease V gamma subunit
MGAICYAVGHALILIAFPFLMLQLFCSNRYETLCAALLADLGAQRTDVWHSPPVIVPSAAVQRRLEMDIAASQGVCANVAFSYLAPWLWAQTARVMPVPGMSPFTPQRLVWRCWRLLGAAHDGQDENESGNGNGNAAPWRASPRLAAWLDAADDAMLYELAQRVAQLFDHYLTYRPEWLARWQEGESIAHTAQANARAEATWQEDERWQAALWRTLLDEVTRAVPEEGHLPPVYRFSEFARSLDLEGAAREGWPQSVSVFALPTMPPLHIALLRELSRWMDVRIYALNPCREFWFDIVSAARVEKLDAAGQLDYQEVGHPLLAEWGKQTQAQLRMLHELTELAASSETSVYGQNGASTWLAKIQNAILDLHDESEPQRGQAENACANTKTDTPRQAGIEVHVCHSMTRQLEVLHDQLLDWFNTQPDLQPADVLVVLPNLVNAAPLIDAVFGAHGASHDDARRIPYRITGLPPSQTNPVARALLDWLALDRRRVSAPELLEWLRVDAVATRLEMDASALETVQTWLDAAGARRGLAPGPVQHAQASVARHTFTDALTRLFLGYALPPASDPVDAWLPVEGATGSRAPWLGQLARFIDALDAFAQAISTAHTPDEWHVLLHSMLTQCFDSGPRFAHWLADMRDAIEPLVEAMHEGAHDALIPAAVIRSALAGALDDPAHGGVPGGGVTFAPLSSLRGLPYRAICVLGMDDHVLPGPQRADEFDLMAVFPQPGDRQRRDDERNLFLDLLLAARDKLLIAYTGRSQRDNTVLPPAALVDELLDHLARLSCGPEASLDEMDNARRAFITEHPLQPFSPDYFSGRGEPPGQNGQNAQNGQNIQNPQDKLKLFTYEPVRAGLAQHLAAPRTTESAPFFAAPLPPEVHAEVAFDDFLWFWHHPVNKLLRDRLGIMPTKAQRELADIEPFTLEYPGDRTFADRLLPILLDPSHDVCNDAALRERVQRIAAASPELPEGATGAVWCEREQDGLYDLARRVYHELELASAQGGDLHPVRPESLPFSLPIAPRWPEVGKNNAGAPITLFGKPEYDALLREDAQAQPVLLHGTLGWLTAAGQILFDYRKANGRDYLKAWVSHLVYCAVQPDGPRRTVWHGKDKSFSFTPADDAQALLAPLMALYLAGRRMPLRLLPGNVQVSATKEEVKLTANQCWPDLHECDEACDPGTGIAFRGTPLTRDDPCDALVQCLFGPLGRHLSSLDAQ